MLFMKLAHEGDSGDAHGVAAAAQKPSQLQADIFYPGKDYGAQRRRRAGGVAQVVPGRLLQKENRHVLTSQLSRPPDT
jgi:hypothetical protein